MKIKVFIDSSVIIATLLSADGGSAKVFKVSNIKISKKISKIMLKDAEAWIKDRNDAPILAAAKLSKVDVILTLDIRHFIKDTDVTRKSGMQIMTPGEFLRGFLKIG